MSRESSYFAENDYRDYKNKKVILRLDNGDIKKYLKRF
jgi:hypothetical protein